MAQQPSDNPYKAPGAALSESRGFQGVNLWTNPQDQTGNMLLQADNLIQRSGMLYVRPGLSGMFGGNPPSSSSLSSSSSSSVSLSSSSSSQYFDEGGTYYSIPGSASYYLASFYDGSGNCWEIFVSGGKLYKTQQASGSYTELLNVGNTSYALSSPVTQAAILGDYLYLVDGNSQLLRVDLSGGFPATGLNAPAGSPSAQLTNTLLWQANSATNWSTDGQSIPFTTLMPNNGYFTNAAYTVLNPAGESVFNPVAPGQGFVGIINYNSSITLAGGPGDGLGGYITVPPLNGTVSETPILYPSRFHLRLIWATNDDGGNANTYSGQITIYGYNAAQQLIDSQTFSLGAYNNSFTIGGQKLDEIVDFSTFGPTVQYLRFKISMVNTNSTGNFAVGGLAITPISVQTTFKSGPVGVFVYPTISGPTIGGSSSSGSSLDPNYYSTSSLVPDIYSSSSNVQTFSSSSSSSSIYPTSSSSPIPTEISSSSWVPVIAGNSQSPVAQLPEGDLGTILDYAGESFIFTFPADYSSSSNVPTSGYSSSSSSISPYSSSSPIPTNIGANLTLVDRLTIAISGLSSWQYAAFSLSLQQSDGSWVLADNGVTIDPSFAYLYCDISTLPSSQLSNVLALKLTFQVNVNWVAPFYALVIGPITTPGNLSIGDANYIWYVTETDTINSTNIIESNPSLPSNALVPTQVQAEGLVTIPAGSPTNPTTNGYKFYRLGGTDSAAILVASVSKTVSVAYGTDPLNPYYSWNAVTGVFLDNTPDIFLAISPLLAFTRNPMVSNGQAIASWQDRLWIAVGNQLYGSWLGTSSTSAALYTTLVNGGTNDPNLPIEGFSSPITADPTDTVVAMTAFGTPVAAGNQFGGGLIIFCKRSVWLLQGTDPTTFSLRQYDYGYGVGLVAMRGFSRTNSNQLVFMGPDRLHVFPPNGFSYETTGVQEDSALNDMGLPIQPQLYPVQPQTLQNQTAFATSWMVYYDSKLYLGCPQPGQTSNSVVWVYDYRVGGWTRLTGPLGGSMNCTSAAVLPPNSNGADFDLYYYGLDGQIRRSIGTVDQNTPVVATAAIPFDVVVHAMRPAFYVRYKARPLYYMLARLEWAEIEMIMNGTLSITGQAWDVGLENPVPISGLTSVQTYGLQSGGNPFRIQFPGGLLEGNYLTLELTGAVTDVAYLRGVRGLISGTYTEYA